MNRYRQNYEVPTTRSPWPARLAGSLLIVVLLGLLFKGMVMSAEQEEAQMHSLASAEGAAFEAGQAVAREDIQGAVVEAYERGRRDALAEIRAAEVRP